IKQRYLGLVTLVDRSVGAILRSLEQFGLMDETIIVHTSDHGDCLGAHQLFGKEVMLEEAARVPYLIRMPGQRCSMRINQSISHIDFLPTLLELLGQTKPPHCPGQSRAPLLKGEIMPPESVFIEWSPNRAKTVKRSSVATRRQARRAMEESTRTVVTSDGWKLCLRDQDLNELYNLKGDPIEAHNLYYTGKYDAVIARGRDEIHRWQETTEDRLKIKSWRKCEFKPAPQSVALPVKFWRQRIGRARLRRAAPAPFRGSHRGRHRFTCCDQTNGCEIFASRFSLVVLPW